MKIAIVILAADGNFKDLVDGIRKTWAAEKHPDVDIYYNYCYRKHIPKHTPNTTILYGDQIVCGYEDGMHSIHQKSLDAFEWLSLNRKYDYVFRCCCGSYVIQENLLKYLDGKPNKGFYSGVLGNAGFGPYCSGSGYFLSWDLVKEVGLNKHMVKKVDPIYDDVNLGHYLLGKGVIPVGGYRWDYNSGINELNCLMQIETHQDENNPSKPSLGYHYHYHVAHDYSASGFIKLHELYKSTRHA
jgi:hypothetical protein